MILNFVWKFCDVMEGAGGIPMFTTTPYTHARPTIYKVPDAYELFVPLFED